MPTPSDPADFFKFTGTPRNKAEEEFKECMKRGEPCVFGSSVPDEGDETNAIRADMIRFFARGGDETCRIQGNIIHLRGAYVLGHLDLENVLSECALVMAKCRFNSPIGMANSKFRVVNLDGSYLTGGLRGGGMHVDRDMYMDNGFIAEGEVNLLGANIGGGLYCDSGKFRNKGEIALGADRLKVGENWFMRDGFSAEGEVRLLSARIKGDLICNNCKFDNKQGVALAADMARIDGKVFLQNKFTAEGEVRFPNAHIGADFSCDGGTFINKGEVALGMDGINVGTILSLQDGFCAEGKVWMVAAKIGRDFYCNNGNFKDMLVADGIKVNGNFFMRGNFVADGMVQFPGAYIGGDCVCEGVFNAGLNAITAQIKSRFVWDTMGGQGGVSLAHATAGILHDSRVNLENFVFFLYGFSYEKLDDPWDVKSRIDWLCRRPIVIDFSPQPFEQAAKVLFAMGHNNDAREVLWEKEKRLTEEGKLPDWHKPLRHIWNWLAGYGYRLRRTLGAAAFVIGLGWAVFAGANYYGHIVPHQPVVMAKLEKETEKGHKCTKSHPTEATVCLLPQYPRFDALAYSADVFIPFFALHQEPYWYPQPRDKDNYDARLFLTIFLWFEIVAGWILTSLLVLTITGLLKPRQSSLE